ncbi:MAG: hypothetical protein Q9227_002085 [Pyrenula ochraceoflavens]
MRRGPNPAAERAAQNQQTIKSLLKLEPNKTCADCKRNKHPRWASWNLGVFVCIRCSGIHRGMGTHISRVKSVDLDAWTDEQLQSILKWGNSRANKYWEAKLAPGHVPAEAKIENFIRTKYESRRWVMDGPMPDPSTLDAEGDDDVPLSIVQEKAKIERASSHRISSAPQPAQPTPQRVPPQPSIDLFGDETPAPPARPSTTDIPSRPQAKAAVQPPPKQNKPGDSLLGLDFFGSSQPSNGRPSSAASNPLNSTAPSRPDLKQSILSLYSSAPKPQPPAQTSPHGRQSSFGGMSPPVVGSPPAMSSAQPQNDAFGGLSDAFSGLSFSNTTSSPPPPKQSSFSGLETMASPTGIPQKSSPVPPKVTSPSLGGGSFFDPAPPKNVIQPKPFAAPGRTPSTGLDFMFAQAAPAPPKKSPAAAPPPSQDLFDTFDDFASPAPAPAATSTPAQPKPSSPPAPSGPTISSAFNLSSPTTTQPAAKSTDSKPPLVASNTSSMFDDPWGSGNAWSTPEESAPAPPPKPRAPSIGRPPDKITPNDFSGGWGGGGGSLNVGTKAEPVVAKDEDFGGWTSAPTASGGNQQSKPSGGGGGFGGSDDLFSNVWQ